MSTATNNNTQQPIQSAADIGGNHFNKNGRDRPVPSQYKHLSTVIVGEFCGTFMFLLLSFIGAQAAIDNNPPNDGKGGALAPQSLLYIASAFGSSLAINVWIFYRVTGGMFNPAVSQEAPRTGIISDDPSRLPSAWYLLVPLRLFAVSS